MKIHFAPRRDDAPELLVAEAELIFEDGEPLAGLKLVGFSIYKNAAGRLYVTLPSRAFGMGEKRQYFDFLRSAKEKHSDTQTVKDSILGAWSKNNPPVA